MCSEPLATRTVCPSAARRSGFISSMISRLLSSFGLELRYIGRTPSISSSCCDR